MESYLKNRKQYVTYNDNISETLPITTGVPQGSIIGPLLFVIYMNDLSKSSTTFQYVMYAHDTTLFTTIQSLNSCTKDTEQYLNTELNKVNEWLKINKLSLNIKKSKYITHKLRNKKIIPLLLKIDETRIERVQNVNLLGVTLQENLSWDSHIKKYFYQVFKNYRYIKQIKTLSAIKYKSHFV